MEHRAETHPRIRDERETEYLGGQRSIPAARYRTGADRHGRHRHGHLCYGTPVKEKESDAYTLSGIANDEITVTSTGIPKEVGGVTFTIPVNPDGNHIGYTVTVTVSVIHTVPKQITVKVKSSSRPLPRPIPLLPIIRMYQADIIVEATGTEIAKVEYSDYLGLVFTTGRQKTSLLPITHFYIRVTEADYTRHLYEYRNGRVDER